MNQKKQLAQLNNGVKPPLKGQLLKWIGNKQRMAEEIISFFPQSFGTYYEPFLGSGGVLGMLAPTKAVGSDVSAPLMEIWQTLAISPNTVKKWYMERWYEMMDGDKVDGFEKIKARYNANPNGADLLFICRSCYGGVVRFRKRDGYISTPCGIHSPISPSSFADRVDTWRQRIIGTKFKKMDYRKAMEMAVPKDLVYCDPPYRDTQAILYGAQKFSLEDLLETIGESKKRGVFVALSIDGTKKSGNKVCNVPIPKGLFKREFLIHYGSSMLKRFQMNGKSLKSEHVADRLLLTF